MAQETILATGTTAATSTDIELAAGESAVVGIFSDGADGPAAGEFLLLQATPGADNSIATLSAISRAVILSGPGTFRVRRKGNGQAAFGVFAEIG